MAGTHEDLSRTHAVKDSSNRSFGLVFTAAFVVIALSPLIRGGALRWWALVAAGVTLLITSRAPAFLALPKRVWLAFGALLHRLISPVVLGFLFYAVVTPMAGLVRLFGKDSMRRRRRAGHTSYWIPRDPPGPRPESLSHQF
jgi:hypothetical protein